MTRAEEFAVKLERLRRWLATTELRGVALRTRANFAWITCGGRSFVSRATDLGVGTVFITPDRVVLAANNIELARFEAEEIGPDLPDFQYAEFPWHDPDGATRVLDSLSGGGAYGVDAGPGQPNVANDVVQLRNPLTTLEIDHYRQLGQAAGETTDAVCRQIRPGMTELDVTSMVHAAFERQGIRVPVNLVAADERIDLRRHPIVTDHRIDRRVMVVVGAERRGLNASLTRLVDFTEPGGELKIKHRAVCQIDATANTATRPGRPICDVFADIQAEYARQGFGDEWQYHHQGGPTGYAGRDVLADAHTTQHVMANQAFAWNPSITGTKSEDTILVTESGFDMLTAPGPDWPQLEIERDGVVLRRADILVAQ
ncbi:MAG: peptidase M24 [Planctomycetaceae bacterium]|nr:peptidase M24 [Planctomycetaceae bacterium]